MYSQFNMVRIHVFKVSSILVTCLLIILLNLLNSTAYAGGGRLEFKNASLVSGVAGSDNAVYRFPQVDNNVDALVRIVRRSNALVYLVNIDNTSSGFDKAWQPLVGYNGGSAPGAADWWMDFEVLFVESGSSTLANVTEFNLTAIDIDGNNHLISEYVAFFELNSYTLESNSILAITDIEIPSGDSTFKGKRFDGPTQNYTNIDTSGTSVMVTSKYVNTQSYYIRVGGVSSGASGASERMYSLYHQEFNYNEPAISLLPLQLKNFQVQLWNEKVRMNWSFEDQADLSHFVVQRSVDGTYFTDAMIVLENEHSFGNSYIYTEPFQQGKAEIFYRLKVVDRSGKYGYSQVRKVTIGSVSNTTIVNTFPNPVMNEVRITVPPTWQGEQVSYELYNINGAVLRSRKETNAGQTARIDMADVRPGLYILKVKSENVSVTKQILKM